MVQELQQFFLENTPTVRELLLIGPLCALWAFGSLWLAGYVKRSRNVKTGYTRKIFHFLIFSSAAAAILYMSRMLCHGGIPVGKFLQIFLEKSRRQPAECLMMGTHDSA